MEGKFIDTWIRSDSQGRSLLTDIANWIDDTLSDSPELKGQEESASVRLLAFLMRNTRVSVAYQVMPEDRKVYVIRMALRNWRSDAP
jgi:hypothetical protein